MKRLKVFLCFEENNEIFVGELAEKKHRIYFQYDTDFISKSLWLSPYKLPLNPDLQEHRDMDFGPLFGVFDDSLPDGWGLMLMDRFLKSRGFSISEMSVLDRLSFLGVNTMGALTYKPKLEVDSVTVDHFDLYNLYVQSQKIITGKTESVLMELVKAGGSPGGARPKVLVGIHNDKLVSGEGKLPAGFESWMIKFNGLNDFTDSGPVEYAYSLMAKDCGIYMPETRIFDTKQGERFFGVKRFDRDGNKRYHSHTFGNLIHSNFRIPSSDYEMLFRVINDLTKNYQDLLKGFRQMVFNIFTNNRDDHVKNFSFIMNSKGEWSLSPAYDLTFAVGPGGEHSMTVDGEGRSPSLENIYNIGEKSGLKKKNITLIIDQVLQTAATWPEYAEISGVSERTMEVIGSVLTENRLRR
ncbi:MAG: type II toxin-antitoxin system HipA family toxin [Spirochaetota bacterium]|nr:type II toxin-antitoxin system HipA family toxin [Spirochaetota bacterium]